MTRVKYFVLHTWGDVEPVVIAGPLKDRGACVRAARLALKTGKDATGENEIDPEGGLFILKVMGGGIVAETFAGLDIDDARESAQEAAL